ncbi:chemotaxis protein CheW [Shouchella patagoniensis]|uniref:chemotaxis protein CheW n=1 Tax=Shouchella patagoniensis TaxID=228576 RepID=UPI0009949273|nr:chemotaxis protein CheW [Shouchella patagoniensis]
MNDQSSIKAIVFSAGGDQYGIKLLELISIEKAEGITRVPNASEMILGIVSIRGQLLPVIDTGKFLKGKPCAMTDQTRLLVCRQEHGNMALAVEQASDLIEVEERNIDRAISSATNSYQDGVISLASGLMTLVKAKSIADEIKIVNKQ